METSILRGSYPRDELFRKELSKGLKFPTG